MSDRKRGLECVSLFRLKTICPTCYTDSKQFSDLFAKYLPMKCWHSLEMSKYKKNTQFLLMIHQVSIFHNTKGQCF